MKTPPRAENLHFQREAGFLSVIVWENYFSSSGRIFCSSLVFSIR
jgi:hypothetical protein